MTSPNIVLCQVWTESERGWGQRPDGYSLHLAQEDLESYIKANWGLRPNPQGFVPDEYSFPDGDPFLVEATDEQMEKLKVRGNGIRLNGKVPPKHADQSTEHIEW